MDLFFRMIKYIEHFFISKRRGKGVHSEFVYRFLEQSIYNDYQHYFFGQVQEVRNKLKRNHNKIYVEDFGAGSKIYGKSGYRIISEIYNASSSPQWKSALYFRMLNYLKCKNILELGTNLGINAYMLSALGKNVTINSVEGSKELYKHAVSLMRDYKIENVNLFHQKFDEFLDNFCLTNIDAAIIDGNHSGDAITRYTKKIILESSAIRIIILDDIYWSRDMFDGWMRLQHQTEPQFIFLDFYYFGVILIKKDLVEKKCYKLFI